MALSEIQGPSGVTIQRTRLGWHERPVTDPKHMVASLRYAARIANKEDGVFNEGSFAIPYHKLINGESLMLWIRHQNIQQEEWSIDVGNFNKDLFISKGWIDFGIREFSGYEEKSKGIEGKISQAIGDAGIFEGNVGVADRYSLSIINSGGEEGMPVYVLPEVREQKVALSLVNAARVISAERGAGTMMLGPYFSSNGVEGMDFISKLGYPHVKGYSQVFIPTRDRVGQRQDYPIDYPVPPGDYPYKFI